MADRIHHYDHAAYRDGVQARVSVGLQQGLKLMPEESYLDVQTGQTVHHAFARDPAQVIPYIWSHRLNVWFLKGTPPEKAHERLKADRKKFAQDTRISESMARYKGQVVRIVTMSRSGKVVEWKHGKGPCGRTVVGLKVSREHMPGWLTIWQWCEDGPLGLPDEFCYPLDQITALRLYQTDHPVVKP